MPNTFQITSSMEKLSHSNPAFPVAEFVDKYNLFAGGRFPSHWHNELEIQIILKGSAKYTVNGEDITVNEGEAIYIAPSAIHQSISLNEDTIGYNLLILPSLFTSVFKTIHCEQYSQPLSTMQPSFFLITSTSKAGFEILESLKHMYYSDPSNSCYEILYLQNLLGIWRSLLSIFPKYIFKDSDYSTLLREQRMRAMLDYIHENYSSHISISDIAKSADISKSECFRCFADISLLTPVEYINQYRLFEAAKLLISTDLPITDICYSVGFNSTSYFSKEFKKMYNMTPREYKKNKVTC